MSETTPDRLVAALTAAGWAKAGHAGPCVRLRFGERSVLVPTDPGEPAFDLWMAGALRELRQMANLGLAADHALTEATCSCGGRRWVDDENCQTDAEAVREPGRGLVPCGTCNHGGWNVPVGGGES